jgi:predicted dehydrogenase
MDKRFKIVVAGCGGISTAWFGSLKDRDDYEIVGLVDLNEQNADRVKHQHNLSCGIYKDVKEAIKSTGANLVFDLTIPASHKQVVTDALSMGCSVFGEKPMAPSMDECREMVSLSNSTGKLYAVMQNYRYNKPVRTFKKIIESGVIGKPVFITADFFLGVHFGGFRDVMDSPLLVDMSVHTFDTARFLTDGDPVSVYCQEFNPAGSWYKGNASAVCTFEFDGGLMFSYRGSWCAEGCNTSWNSSWRVVGTRGTAVWNGGSSIHYETVDTDAAGFTKPGQHVDVEPDWQGRESHAGCLDEMFDALINNRKPETECNDNIKTISMVLGALDSAKLGSKISLK